MLERVFGINESRPPSAPRHVYTLNNTDNVTLETAVQDAVVVTPPAGFGESLSNTAAVNSPPFTSPLTEMEVTLADARNVLVRTFFVKFINE